MCNELPLSCCYKIFSLSFHSLIIMSFSVALFEFTHLGIWWVSWLCKFMPFIKFGKCQPLFPQIPSSLFVFSPSDALVMYMLVHFIFSHRFYGLCLFFFILCFFSSSSRLISMDLSSSSLIIGCWKFFNRLEYSEKFYSGNFCQINFCIIAGVDPRSSLPCHFWYFHIFF